jgi:hypothetical protein
MMSKAGEVGINASRKLAATVKQELGAATYSTAYSAGIDAIRSPVQAGVQDIVSEAMGGWGRQLEDWVTGGMGEEARATRAAREETIQSFGMVTGAQGDIPPEARAFMAQRKDMHMLMEKGRKKLETEDNFRVGIDDILNKVGDKLGALLTAAVEELWNKMKPWSGK